MLIRGTISALLLLGSSLAVMAEPVLGNQPIMLYRSDDAFETVKENLETAIANQGLTVSGTLHVSEMLARTGPDLGFPKPVYSQAESLEFCSALMSHQMTQASPLNAAICPFTIALYVKTEEPGQVYVAFRKPRLAGDAQAVTEAVNTLLTTIVHEALGED